MNLKQILYLLTYKKIILYVHSNSTYQNNISNLLDMKNLDHLIIYKSKNNQRADGKKNENKREFYVNKYLFLILFYFNFKSKKLLFVSQPLYFLPYLFFKKCYLLCYDCHFGLPNSSTLKVFLEKLAIKFSKNLIHRDLRLWAIYKKQIKSKRNILIPDLVFNQSNNSDLCQLNESNDIHAAVIGWIDNLEVSVLITVRKLLSLNVFVHFFCPLQCLKELEVELQNLKQEYPKQILIEDFYAYEELIKKISKFHIGVCPHSTKVSKINKIYRRNCGSSRIIDYISANLLILCSKKSHFQKFICRSYNANHVNIFDIDTIGSKNELVFFINKNKINKIIVKKKIFEKKNASKVLSEFID